MNYKDEIKDGCKKISKIVMEDIIESTTGFSKIYIKLDLEKEYLTVEGVKSIIDGVSYQNSHFLFMPNYVKEDKGKPFGVIAGKHSSNGPNCKYCDNFYTLEEAISKSEEYKGYDWSHITYNGKVLDIISEEKDFFKE